MKRLGNSVYDLYKKQKEHMRAIDVLKLGLQMIKALEEFHKAGFIHQDIKINNFMFDYKDRCPLKNNHVRC